MRWLRRAIEKWENNCDETNKTRLRAIQSGARFGSDWLFVCRCAHQLRRGGTRGHCTHLAGFSSTWFLFTACAHATEAGHANPSASQTQAETGYAEAHAKTQTKAGYAEAHAQTQAKAGYAEAHAQTEAKAKTGQAAGSAQNDIGAISQAAPAAQDT